MTTGTDAGEAPTGPRGCDCKVGRVADAYDLDGADEELESRWTGRGAEKHSLRALERFFNERVLAGAFAAAGVDTLEGEVENYYELLAGEAPESTKVEARRRLAREGVDVDRVESDFVSHQSVHGHLRECRGVSLEEEDPDPVTSGRDTVSRLQTRLNAVTENVLDRLVRKGAVSLGGFSVLVSVRVTCEDCGRYHEAADLLDRGGCDCRVGDDPD